jgi:predicted transglutaminase-like cysteine proteinase
MLKLKVILIGVLLGSSLVMAGVVDFSPALLKFVSNTWGTDAIDRLQTWRENVIARKNIHLANKSANETLAMDDLQNINAMWNKIPYYTDIKHWKLEDYWATPVETLGSNGGDCEDFAIGKYFSLKELGIPIEKLRITYVRALKIKEPHMVLAYYPTPDAEPYILDILTGKIKLASERSDLEPVYSFNDEDLWAAGATGFKGKSSQIRLWRDLLDKMEKERQM